MELLTELDVFDEKDFEVSEPEKISPKEWARKKAQAQLKLKQERFLSMRALSNNEIEHLIEPNEKYARWIRVLVLRILAHTSALGKIKSNSSYMGARVFEYLGFENMEAFSSKRELTVLRQDLLLILADWEEEFGNQLALPAYLNLNLEQLAIMANLGEIEKRVLGLAILIHSETIIQDALELIGENVSAYTVPRIFAPLLGLKLGAVEEVFDDQSKLMKSGLLSLDHRGEGSVRSRVDLITWTFAKRAVMKQSHVRDLIKGFVVPAKKSSLGLEDFGYIAERLQTVKEYLDSAIKSQSRGVNILIYGLPGTGKTEFAKLISQEIRVDLMEISAMDLRGQPITPMLRIRGYRLTQALFHEGNTAILFDECEEVLAGEGVALPMDESSLAQKSWINMALENNKLPSIWVANSIADFEPAYIRRFDICFEMPMPNELKRREMLTQLCGKQINQDLILEFAKSRHISPALVAKTSQVIGAVSSGKSQGQLNELALMLVNDKLQAQGVAQIQSADLGAMEPGFDPAMINSPVNLENLRDGIAKTGEARICLYGPPGTGKTAFGKWLAGG